jgi:hypothetical protein
VVFFSGIVVGAAERAQVGVVVGAASPAADDVVADERAAVTAREGAAVAIALEDASAGLLPFSGEVERIGPLDERRDSLPGRAHAGLKHSQASRLPIGRALLARRMALDRDGRPGRTFWRATRSGT